MSDPIENQLPHWNEQRYLFRSFKEESLLWFSWNTARLFTSRNLLGIFSNDYEYDNLRYYRGKPYRCLWYGGAVDTWTYNLCCSRCLPVSEHNYSLDKGLETELPIAFGVAFLLGLIVGFPSLRVNELYLALATFAVAFVGVQVLFEWKQFSGGGSGKPVGKLELLGMNSQEGQLL
ncbi:MAG: hypothetical protein CM15mP49_06260 [Actinomycetota bacterium]|nr:MAG: hypothetical protein CM15mP49_06260 [Actinomycetota bacterium]